MKKQHKEHLFSRHASDVATSALNLGNSLLRISCELSLKVMFFVLLIGTTMSPAAVSAHEVYVLDHAQIEHAIQTPSPNPFTALAEQEELFLLYGAAIGFGVLLIFALSISPLFERVCNPWLSKLKPWAPFVARLTLGVSLIASGCFGASFGPELPFTQIVSPQWVPVLGILMVYAGVFITLGLLTRIVALLGIVLFAFLVWANHAYMLTYMSYLGEFILFIILGGGMWSLDSHIPLFRNIDDASRKLRKKLEPYSFVIMRVLFGCSILFATFYSKFLHSNLALDTVRDYGLTTYFHFTPLFLVLGAFMVEAVIGAFVMLGIELRFTALVFTFFLTLSITFFGEAVWPHAILFGVNIALFLHGYDRYTLETACLAGARQKGEPIL
jgi:uncharacterized membrane protein YphA (DoxX/SURF4 family)